MKSIFSILFIVLPFLVFSQTNITGKVQDSNREPLIGATVVWLGTSTGVNTNENGEFSIESIENINQLVVSYIGFVSDTVMVNPGVTSLIINMKTGVELEAIEVKARQKTNFVSALNPTNVETIGAGELKKAACCNLAESFETNGAVNVMYTDAVTGAKEIEMLGLRGIYTQMLLENRPTMRGLGYTFGMENIPGTWVEKIAISKGASTVVNGYESVAGIINTELIKPFDGEKFFLNLYGNYRGRAEANIHINKKFTDKWSTGVLLHGDFQKVEWDHNEDGFLDMPKKDQLNGLYRLFYRGEDVRSQLNVQVVNSNIDGGQVGATPTNDLYGFNINNQRIDVFYKLGYFGFANPFNSIGLITNITQHKQTGGFGNNTYNGVQNSAYANLIYETIIRTSDHKLRVGSSYMYDDYDEIFNTTDFSRTESVAGAFGEYTYSLPEIRGREASMNIIAGLRADYHNIHGLLVTPRFNIRYGFNDNQSVRMSIGKGYRTANIIAENINTLTSARTINILEDFDIEETWNYGFNYVNNFQLMGQDASFSVDLYRTVFQNQVVMDIEQAEGQILFYNLRGTSYANSFLANFSYEFSKNFDIKAVYKYNDVKITFDGDLRQKPLVPKHRGLLSLGYSSPDNSLKAHVTGQMIGQQRVPFILGHENHTSEGHGSLTEYQLLGASPTYFTLNAQVNKIVNKQLEFYIGGENLTNYVQHSPIIGATDPFNNDPGIPLFDGSQIYGPIMGANVYVGMRWTIK